MITTFIKQEMDDEGTHPENGFENCEAGGTQHRKTYLISFCAVCCERAKVFFNQPTIVKSYLSSPITFLNVSSLI